MQLFCLIVLFDLGTALVVNLGASAKQDAWLAILLSAIPGVLLLLVYGSLHKLYPNLPLTGYAREIVGKWIGTLLGLIFIMDFFHLAARDLRDYGDLLSTTIFDKTPLFIIHVMMILTMIYILYLGIEVLGRMAEIYLVMMFFLGFLGIISVLLSGKINISHLFPVLEYGWKPVIITAFPYLFSFPWTEMLSFTLVFPYLNNSGSVKKVGISAILFSAIILSLTAILNISVLSVDGFTRSNFPLFETIRRVRLMEFIERLDPIVLLTLIIGNFFKVIIFFYATVICISDLFRIKNHKNLIFPIGIIILLASLTVSGSFSEHIKIGQKLLPPYIHVPVSAVVPLLLLIVALIRRYFGSR
ncbi:MULTISPECIES: GerAB/ArcD/ProY family transporter [Bacillus]|uniref:GerAB/ArcD/ProY family transporter n=1 Tax=Bacillus TaxID=1386 RepID=UPI001CEF744E|nr:MULTISPECIES: GerAB/ArcD/ProY family transporter [Bacillus]MED1097975.1 GerAB/ArcD/ProY family transporter [Bacillus capparidis]